MELDVISLCYEFSEYAEAREAALSQGWQYDGEFDSIEEENSAALEWLQDQTTVITHDSGVIIQSF